MDVKREKILSELKSIDEPKLVHEGSFPNDQTLRVFTGEGGYLFQTDEHPISGPLILSGDEYEEARRTVEEDENVEEHWEPSEQHIEMFRAGCEPGINYYRYFMNVRSEDPIYSVDLRALEEMLIEDIMDNIDCELWTEMTDADLEEWYLWYEHSRE